MGPLITIQKHRAMKREGAGYSFKYNPIFLAQENSHFFSNPKSSMRLFIKAQHSNPEAAEIPMALEFTQTLLWRLLGSGKDELEFPEPQVLPSFPKPEYPPASQHREGAQRGGEDVFENPKNRRCLASANLYLQFQLFMSNSNGP